MRWDEQGGVGALIALSPTSPWSHVIAAIGKAKPYRWLTLRTLIRN